MLDASYPSRYCRALAANRLACDNGERAASFAGPCFSNLEADGLARSVNACERGADALWRPSFDRRRRCAGRDKVRTFALAQNHLLTRRGHRYRTPRDEHAEALVARPGEELRAAYRDQREGAANLHAAARAARRSIEQQRPGAQRHLPAGIDKKPIDLQPRLFAKPDRRIAAEPHSQSGRDAGHDFVAEKDRRGPIERAANRVELGECLTLDVLDRADPLDGARRYADKDERECQRSVAKKPASIAGPVAFDLAEVGHRRSPSAWCSREQCLSLSDASGAFCHLGHRGANKRTRWNRPATPPQRRRQVQ